MLPQQTDRDAIKPDMIDTIKQYMTDNHRTIITDPRGELLDFIPEENLKQRNPKQ